MKERILQLIEFLGITVQQFELNVGLSNGAVSKMGDNTRRSTLDRISLKYPNVNISWILTGEGDMLNETPSKENSMRKVDRFDEYMKFKGLNDNKVTNDLKLSVGLLGKSRKERRDLSDNVIELILNFYTDLNRVWLLAGEGEMLNNTTMQPPKHISEEKKEQHLIPFFDDIMTIGGDYDRRANVDIASGLPTQMINTGDWFRKSTVAIRHIGDSMVEYPSGCILALRRVNDMNLLVNGKIYVIETTEYRVTKMIRDEGDHLMAYSSNKETHPDGTLIYAPMKIPKCSIRHIHTVLGHLFIEESELIDLY